MGSPENLRDLQAAITDALSTGEHELAEFWGDCARETTVKAATEPVFNPEYEVAKAGVAHAKMHGERPLSDATLRSNANLIAVSRHYPLV